MFEKDRNYWLYISPHVYCNLKERKALLYNTHTGERIESADDKILSLLHLLHEKKNLGAIECRGDLLEQEPYYSFVTKFCEKGMGNVVDKEKMPERPIQLMPVLNLQRDVEKLQKERDRHTGEEILHYLLELNVYLYTSCEQHCPFCNDYFRQSLCCTAKHSAQSPETLDISTLQNILLQIRYGAVGKINLLGGNILEYPCYKKLLTLLADFKDRVRIWNHYANFIDNQIVTSDFLYEVPVTFPVDKNTWKYCITLLKETKVRYHFFITRVEEYEETSVLIEEYGISNFAIHPVYTGANHPFFEEYVYTCCEDIFRAKFSFRQLFVHQKLNTRFFGSLTIFPDGNVHADTHNPALGNISTDTLLDIINKEMLRNTAWRKIRDEKPCSDCLYQYLCPSPSNYELAIGKPNLCHVIKS
ncbi:hypothetical protein FACS1894203_2740 [Bacteroidia bacterium]|nr:hypothetical protein FACS1894203_2740 [Bacteroidia bacterium]GHT70504.1 hypothetical protein FACS189455_0310 [Bacteroidia bacterium]GHU87317.1 hypothetical protein FACS1894155_00100 [Bacteroidia bacterium]